MSQIKSRPLSEARLIIVGQGSVGKTALIKRLLDNEYDNLVTKTEGIEIKDWTITIDDQDIKVNIWNFGGQEILHATHQFFLSQRSLYLLAVDARLTQEENRLEYWLKLIQAYGGDSPILIVGTKSDQSPLDIDRTGLSKKYPNIVGFHETSAITGSGIEKLKKDIIDQINALPHVHDVIPETWWQVKENLARIASHYIPYQQYLDLCLRNGISDEASQRVLIAFFHDLGDVLYFQDDPQLSTIVILDPRWVVNCVYKIINSFVLFQNKGILTISMLTDILGPDDFRGADQLFIIDWTLAKNG